MYGKSLCKTLMQTNLAEVLTSSLHLVPLRLFFTCCTRCWRQNKTKLHFVESDQALSLSHMDP